MKRDMDLIRELLLKLEAYPLRAGGIAHIEPSDPAMAVEGKTPDEIEFHLKLLRDVHFIDQGGVEPMIGIGFRKLTWGGYDFLDAVRDPKIWRETKEGAKKAGGFTVDILVAVGKALIKQKLHQIGIDIG
jgi:hypothetical protein